MPKRTRAQAFDEWMRRYIDHPEEYEREFETVLYFLEEKAGGKPVSYGRACDAYLALLEAGEESQELLANPPQPRKE